MVLFLESTHGAVVDITIISDTKIPNYVILTMDKVISVVTTKESVFWSKLKEMVHMINMLTSIQQIDIGAYKNPETTPITLFWLLFVP